MNLTLVKEGNVEDFFKAIGSGRIVQDTSGFYYQLQSGKLVESLDLKNWNETNEFEFGTINGKWKIYKEEKPVTNHTIREHILLLANSRVVKSFYSTGVAKRLKKPVEEVESELNKMAEEGLIQKQYQLLCTNDHCLRVLDVKSDKSQFKDEYECSYCGKEEIGTDNIKEIFAGIK